MWTWQFQLDDILTTLSIIAVVGGGGYRFLVIPLLKQIDAQRVQDLQELDKQRVQDNLSLNNKWEVLADTLKELKEEIKLSRAERIKAETKQVLLSAKMEAIEVRLDEVKGDIHEHITASH